MPVLITCALSPLAHKLKKHLLSKTVILGDFDDVPEFMVRSGKIIKLPSPAATSYQHQMLALCLDYNINQIYPFTDNEKSTLLESSQLFEEYGIIIKDIPDDL